MEKLSMCRICLVENLRMESIVGTYLQEMYQSLTFMPLETNDVKPSHVCYVCCARLNNCYQLRQHCLQSERLFTEMLSSNMSVPVQLEVPSTNRLSATAVSLMSMGGLDQEATEYYEQVAVKIENVAVLDEMPVEEAVSEGELCLEFVKEEPDDITTSVEEPGPATQNPECSTSKGLHENETADAAVTEYNTDTDNVTDPGLHEKVALTSSGDDGNRARIDSGMNTEPKIKKKELPHSCLVCRRSFSRVCHLKRHSRIHTGEKPYQCEVCNKYFRMKTTLINHSRKHTGVKPYKCIVCNKRISTMGNLSKHSRIHTGEKPYNCNVCNKCFSDKCDLKKHSRIHTGEKPYKCIVCNKCFSTTGNLAKHSRIHTGEKPYHCDVCNKCFSDKCDLKKHSRIHTGEKPYKCIVCNKCFSTKGNLSMHSRTHTGEKLYECNVCEKSYIHKSGLTKHFLTHTGEKPNQCEVCKKCFRQKVHLETHKRIHTGEKTHQCNVCLKGFSQKSNLNAHAPTHHSVTKAI